MQNKRLDNRSFAVVAKPIGAMCNQRCTYCYYLEKSALLKQSFRFMEDEVLENYIRSLFRIHGDNAVVEFAWHGGEPTLCGLEFFERAMALEKKYGKGRKVRNIIQTNGTLIDDAWCDFFVRNNFLVGISIDGPKPLHDTFRLDQDGEGTFDRVMTAIRLLQQYDVKFHTMTTINAVNAWQPKEVYLFLRELTDYIHFLPVVERQCEGNEEGQGQKFAPPPGKKLTKYKRPVTDFSVGSDDFGEFLCTVFNIWQKKDFGKKHIQLFEAAYGNLIGRSPGVCAHDALCGQGIVVEANGDAFSCNRYVFESGKLGNIMEMSMEELMESNHSFGRDKLRNLPDECLCCPYISLCFGGCPKDRFLFSKNGQWGRNYLCSGYKRFFAHITSHTLT